MNLRHLQYFCAVLDTGSTVAAAQRCHVSQSVVSAAMSQLEQEFACTLFVRHQRGLQPTAEAWRLQHLARRVLADVAAMKTELHPAKQVPPLRLWAHPALAAAQLGKFLRVLQPVQQRESIQVIEDADTADVWLTAQSCAPADAPFTPLWQERYSLVLPMGHPLSRLPSLDITVLHNEPFVERRHCELAASWHLHLAERGIRPQVVASAPSEEWALELVAAGIGVTIAPIPPGPRRADLVFHDHITELQSVPRVMGATLRTPRAQQHLSAALSAITPLQLQAAA